MAKYSQEITLDCVVSDAVAYCREAIAAMGYSILKEGPHYLKCNSRGAPLSVSSPIQPFNFDIMLQQQDIRTLLKVDASIFGFGPLASSKLKGEVGKFSNQLYLSANWHREGQTASKSSLASEIEKLSQLLADGVLCQDEFNVAKRKLLGMWRVRLIVDRLRGLLRLSASFRAPSREQSTLVLEQDSPKVSTKQIK